VWDCRPVGCGGDGGVAAEAQTPVGPAGSGVLSQSRVYPLDQMPVRKMANGGLSRDVLHGALTTGEVVAVHESEQPAGWCRMRRIRFSTPR